MPTSAPTQLTSGTAQAVLTFLQNVGHRRDIDAYLNLFRRLPQESFAVVALEAAVVERNAGLLAQQARYLGELGLFPCLFAGIDVPGSTEQLATALADSLAQAGVSSRPVRLTGVGARSVRLSAELLRSGSLPVVWSEAADASQSYAALATLLGGLRSRKLVVLRPDGAIGRGLPEGSNSLPGANRPGLEGGLSIINLRNDHDALVGSLDARDRQVLERASWLLRELESDAAQLTALPLINVVSPMNLLRELFTVRGAGTLIKAGPTIRRFAGFTDVDRRRLRQLLESTFARRLRADFFSSESADVFLERGYRGVAIVDATGRVPCLTKFAVDRLAQGEGLGRDLWSMLRRHYSTLCWRTRSNNPIIDWYTTLCDSMVRGDPFTVFCVGVGAQDLGRVVAELQQRTDDFGDPL